MRSALVYGGYVVGRWTASHVPPPVVRWFARRLADVKFWCSPQDRATVIQNYETILGSADPSVTRRAAQAMYRAFGEYLAEFLGAARPSQAWMEKHVGRVGREHLDRLVAQGRGAILLSAHLGNWELAGWLLGELGYPIVGLALSHRDPRVNRLFNELRQVHQVQVIQVEHGLDQVPRLLRQGKFIGFVGDRDFFGHGIRRPFFGRPAIFPKGAATYSLRLNVPVVPCFCIRTGPGRYRLIAEAPIEPTAETAGSVDERIAQLTARYVVVMERYIKANPTQWLMFQHPWS